MSARRITADLYSPNQEYRDRERARRRRLPGISAWVLEWVPPEVADGVASIKDVGRRSRRVVAVLSPRIAEERVYDVAKAIYLAENATPAAMLALLRLKGISLLDARYATKEMDVGGKMVRLPVHQLLFRIGRDPCLYARRVRNLRENSRGLLEWTEIPLPPGVAWPAAGGA